MTNDRYVSTMNGNNTLNLNFAPVGNGLGTLRASFGGHSVFACPLPSGA